MCLNCLSLKLDVINKRDQHLKGLIEEMQCDCCIEFTEFLQEMNAKCKVLVLTKIKHATSGCPKVCKFEGIIKQRIKSTLDEMMELIEDQKEEMEDSCYLNRMDNLKAVYDDILDIEDLDQR